MQRFQSTHPHGVRHICTCTERQPKSFNPRTHTGCDSAFCTRGYEDRVFQSTHPHGVRRTFAFARQSTQKVSIHAPTRGATRCSHQVKTSITSFNPRTHTGCDMMLVATATRIYVSIHAPTRGATFHNRHNQQGLRVSIHAPTRGATYQGVGLAEAKSVSIHAPTRGATSFALNFPTLLYLFQSTHPHGVRHARKGLFAYRAKFQSTHPHGVRLGSIECPVTLHQFQSTHPHGVRHRLDGGKRGGAVSIHAPTRGATIKLWTIKTLYKFQSTHPHGVRPATRKNSAALMLFQSTHPHGVRLMIL